MSESTHLLLFSPPSFLPDLSLRYDVIYHHVDHCSGSKCQRIRQQRFCQNHSEGTQQPSNRLYHPAQLAVPDQNHQQFYFKCLYSAQAFARCFLITLLAETMFKHTRVSFPTRMLSMLRSLNLGAVGSRPGLLGSFGCQYQWPNF